VKTVLKVSRKEIGNVEAADLQARLSISSDAQLKVVEELEQDDKFAFI